MPHGKRYQYRYPHRKHERLRCALPVTSGQSSMTGYGLGMDLPIKNPGTPGAHQEYLLGRTGKKGAESDRR